MKPWTGTPGEGAAGMTIANTISVIKAMRERFDVASLHLGGVHLWPLFRLLLFFAHEYRQQPALAYSGDGGPVPPAAAPPAGMTPQDDPDAVREDLADARLWRSPSAGAGPDILVLQAHTDFTLRDENGACDPLFTGIARTLGREASIAALCNWHPGWGQVLRRQGGYVYQHFWRAFHARRAEIAAWMPEAARWCGFCNGLIGEPAVTPVDLLAWMQRMMGLVPAFTAILQRIDPGIVVLQSSLDIDKFGAIIAARRLGIPVVDHQHGVFTSESELYVSWIDALPGIVDPTPHVYWLWSDYFYRTMPPQTSSVGKMTSGDLRWRPPGESRPLDLPGAARRILYLHQGLPGENDEGVAGVLPGMLLDALRLAPPAWQWLIRLHPRLPHMADPLTRLLRGRGLDNVFVDVPSRVTLQSCLDASDVAVTGYSAAAIEAHDAGLHVVLHDPLGLAMYREAVKQGAMTHVATAEALVRAVEEAGPPATPERLLAERSPALARDALARTLELRGRLRREGRRAAVPGQLGRS